MNIIENAIKYTNKGYVRIDVNYENNTKHFIVTIQDTGPGIPKENLKDIFRPFLRLSKINLEVGLV